MKKQTITQVQLDEWLGDIDANIVRELLYDVIVGNMTPLEITNDVLAYADTIQED